MKKYLVMIFSFFVVLLPFSAQAQLLNYKRREQKIEKVKPATVPIVESQKSNRNVADPEMPQKYEEFYSSIKPSELSLDEVVYVTTRVEKIYDLNDDGILQVTEQKDFFRDVLASVQSRGNFTVSSPLLKTFDSDSDGQINRYEADAIRDLLDEVEIDVNQLIVIPGEL